MVNFLSLLSMSTTLLLAATFVMPALGCVPSSPSNGTTGYPSQELGNDIPADPRTIGYSINHLCINVGNLTASLDFYYNIFGLRRLFTLHVSEHYSITYMGHSQGGKNGTGYQTALELNREKTNSEGLIELIHMDVPDNDLPTSMDTPNTFSHIGMVVPDIEATQARLDSYEDVKVLKRLGDRLSISSKVAGATGLTKKALAQLDAEEIELIQGTLDLINEALIFVEDPDGNLIEIQAQ